MEIKENQNLVILEQFPGIIGNLEGERNSFSQQLFLIFCQR